MPPSPADFVDILGTSYSWSPWACTSMYRDGLGNYGILIVKRTGNNLPKWGIKCDIQLIRKVCGMLNSLH
jgi:hypothetical protein